MNCPLCQNPNLRLSYELNDIPAFQNIVYHTEAEARQAAIADVRLMFCPQCTFVFNLSFQKTLMAYDRNYQNEQAHSGYFQNYLDDIIRLLVSRGFGGSKVIEIGCGRGYFLEKLLANGFDAIGFDPVYDGDQPHIIKDYFSAKYDARDADLIILRHTLEHIPDPLKFLHEIASIAGEDTTVFLELPDFEWIMRKRAFWDIVHEHCNYFNRQSLMGMFDRSECGSLFNCQYMFIIAGLKYLRKKARATEKSEAYDFHALTDQLEAWKKHLHAHGKALIWGAGAKGCNFVNLLDPNREFISAVIDINPMKQNHYMAKTGHKIIGPDHLPEFDERTIIVMNEIYLQEIQDMTKAWNYHIQTLGSAG